ncbi:hypothetical protein H4R34_001230 [Dimargaris verticillata]|uniref:Kinesin motor domain-containing protein n=1 Tax=Dimargaris verticillata TaxID=2761393 RepID=A0A9W8EB43_9FUNG|nr:hypothetical protein H4R34_001230 [Dimargaris verticillata]
MNIGNIAVYTHVVDTSDSSDSQVRLTCGETHKYLTLADDKKEPRRIYIDRCAPTLPQVMPSTAVHDLVRFAVHGGNAGLLTLAPMVPRLASAHRMRPFLDVLRVLEESVGQSQREFRLCFALLGLTDKRCTNLLTEKSVPLAQLVDRYDSLHEVVESCEEVTDRLRRDIALPFILSIRLESIAPTPLFGHLCLMELGAPVLGTASKTALNQAGLSQSVDTLRKIAMILGSGSPGHTMPTSDHPLATLAHEFIGGQAKTAFVFHLPSQLPSSAEAKVTLDFIELLRMIRCRQVPNRVDPRVMYYHEKSQHYRDRSHQLQQELETCRAQLATQAEAMHALEQANRDQRAAHQTKEQEWSEQSAQYRQQIESHSHTQTRQHSQLKFDSSKLSTENATLTDTIRQLEIDLAARQAQLDDRESVLRSQEQQIAQLARELHHLQKKLAVAAKSHDQFHTEYEIVYDKYELLKETHAALETTYSELCQKRQHLTDTNATLNHTLEQLQMQCTQLTADLAQVEAQANDAQQRCQKAEQAHTSVQSQLTAVQRAHNELLQSAAQSDRSYQVLRTEFEKLSAHHVTANEAIKEARAQTELIQRDLVQERLRACDLEIQVQKLELARSQLAAGDSHRDEVFRTERQELLDAVQQLKVQFGQSQAKATPLPKGTPRPPEYVAWQQEKQRLESRIFKLKDRLREAVDIAAHAKIELMDQHGQRSEPTNLTVRQPEPATSESDALKPKRSTRRRPTKAAAELPMEKPEDNSLADEEPEERVPAGAKPRRSPRLKKSSTTTTRRKPRTSKAKAADKNSDQLLPEPTVASTEPEMSDGLLQVPRRGDQTPSPVLSEQDTDTEAGSHGARKRARTRKRSPFLDRVEKARRSSGITDPQSPNPRPLVLPVRIPDSPTLRGKSPHPGNGDGHDALPSLLPLDAQSISPTDEISPTLPLNAESARRLINLEAAEAHSTSTSKAREGASSRPHRSAKVPQTIDTVQSTHHSKPSEQPASATVAGMVTATPPTTPPLDGASSSAAAIATTAQLNADVYALAMSQRHRNSLAPSELGGGLESESGITSLSKPPLAGGVGNAARKRKRKLNTARVMRALGIESMQNANDADAQRRRNSVKFGFTLPKLKS